MSFLRNLHEMSLKYSDPDEHGKRKIDYDPDSPEEDDPEFKPFTSTKGKGYHTDKEQFDDVLGGHIGSYRENKILDNLVNEKPGVLQTKVPRYYGFNHESPALSKHKTKPGYNLSPEDEANTEKYSEPFLKALKGKSNDQNLEFKPEALDKLVKRGANDVVHKMKTTPHHKIHFDKFDQVFILPAPSSAGLSDHFSKELKAALSKEGVKAEIVKGLMQKKKIPRASGVWSVTQKNKKSKAHFIESIDNLKRLQPKDTRIDSFIGHGFGGFQKGIFDSLVAQLLAKNVATEDQIRDAINREFDEIENESREIEKELETDLPPRRKKQLEAAYYAHQDALDYKPEALKMVERKIKTKKKKTGWDGKTVDKDAQLSMAKFSNKRNQLSGFTKHDKDHPELDRISDPNKKTLLIFSDDNIDSGSTIDDFYRHMFKEGLINKNTFAVAAALHKMTTSRGSYGKHLQNYRDQGQGIEKKPKAQSASKPKTKSQRPSKPTPPPPPVQPARSAGNMDAALEYAQDEVGPGGELHGLKFNPKHPKINAIAKDIADSENVAHNVALNAIKQVMTGVSESFIGFLIGD